MSTEKILIEMCEGAFFDRVWPHIKMCMIAEKETWERDFTLEEVYNAVKAGLFQLWTIGGKKAIKLVIFTDRLESQAGIVLRVRWVYGSGLFSEYVDVVEGFLHRLAVSYGAGRIEFEGSFALYRKVKARGMEAVSVKYSIPTRIASRN